MTRRRFVGQVTFGTLAVGEILPHIASAADSSRHQMTLCLVPGAIGVNADQRKTIQLAAQYGFTSVAAYGDYLAGLSNSELAELKKEMDQHGLVFGVAGLPVDFRSDETTFQNGIKRLPRIAKGLARAGADRIGTWIMPCHDSLTYLQNFKRHSRRLGEICSILADHNLRLGLEYVGTQTLRTSRKYPFVHTMAETQELIAETGASNCGFVLDAWHWWTAGDTVDDLLSLSNQDVVSVDLNDAPAGVPRSDVQDGRRELPAATGVIDVKAFLGALRQIGYDGPVRAEPFNQELNQMDNATACQATIEALKKAFATLS